MSDQDLAEQIAAAAAYDESLVPALFQEWAPRVVAAAHLQSGDRVLDVGCSTGVLARAAASRVGPRGSVTGVDPNPGMLTVVARLSPGIDWQQGTAESLPFPDQSFDATVSQSSLMFFTDRQQAVREMLRVLASRGRLAVTVWDSLENIPAYSAEVELLRRTVGDRAADALRAPFALGDLSTLRSLFASAGLSSTTITTHQGSGRFPSIRSMVEPDLAGWLPVMGVTLTKDEFNRVLDEAEETLIQHEGQTLFIAECKFWDGPKAFSESIDQILGYTTWRDTKIAIFLFNTRRDFTRVLERVDSAIPTHSCFVRKLHLKDDKLHQETVFPSVFHHPTDVAKEIYLTVMAFDIPKPEE